MVKEYQTLSIVAGTWYPIFLDGERRGGCGAGCGGCVALMTTVPSEYLALSFPGVDRQALSQAANLAIAGGAETVIWTGKKNPDDYQEQTDFMLDFLNQPQYGRLVFKEMQTNGLNLTKPEFQKKGWLYQWVDKGLTHVNFSVVHVHDKANDQYLCNGRERYPGLDKLIGLVLDAGATPRVSVIANKQFIHSSDDIEEIVNFCRQYDGVELTIRPMNKTNYPPTHQVGRRAYDYVEKYQFIKDDTQDEWAQLLAPILSSMGDFDVAEFLANDAVVYEYRGQDGNERPQNLCLTDCLTHTPKEDLKKGAQRQIIFYPNGIISNDWTHVTNRRRGMGRAARQWLKEMEAKQEASGRRPRIEWSKDMIPQ